MNSDTGFNLTEKASMHNKAEVADSEENFRCLPQYYFVLHFT